MRGGPQRLGRVHQVSVVLEIDGEAAVFTISNCRTHCSGSAIAYADRSRLPDVMIVLLETPKLLRPSSHTVAPGNQGPVLVFDLRPKFGGDTRSADGALVPSIGCQSAIMFVVFLM